ncbi:double zinc ribbon domain-containing protein [Pseudoprimorskyibacter insulae]|nr:double zinc ribbon domain-containing protein [Pseudoprimorskyibacter insulae]
MQSSLSLLYPARCLCCGGMVDGLNGLCGPCWRDLPLLGAGCYGCAAPLPSLQPGEEAYCDDCLTAPRPWRRGVAALGYSGTARQLVLALKHGDRHDISKPAATWLARPLRDLVTADTVLVPVPLHPWRRLARRFNQSALIAQDLADVLGCDWAPDALRRTTRTRSLGGLTRDERHALMSDAIAPNPKYSLQGRAVVIVDDVMTSGATFSATTTAAYAAGAKDVCVAALARVTKEAYIKT